MISRRLLDRVVTVEPTGNNLAVNSSYRPVFLMHGINDNAKSEFTSMVRWIEAAHPGTSTFPIALYEDEPASWVALEIQLKTISRYIRKLVSENPSAMKNGYHLVCHSQGGLICRTLVEYMEDHKVHTLISLAGPQMGVYGPAFFDFIKNHPLLKNVTYETLWTVAYTTLLQKLLSVVNIWHDPMHAASFLHDNEFLPKYNGLTQDSGNAVRKANFIRLEKAVFLTGYPDASAYDGGIEPARSGIFDFYKDGSQTEYVPMKESTVYTSDTFGLQTLDRAGKLVTQGVPGIGHHNWVDREDVFQKYILPHLV